MDESQHDNRTEQGQVGDGAPHPPPPGFGGGQGWDGPGYRQGGAFGAYRSRTPGRSSLNRALVALAVAAAGYALGLIIPALANQSSTNAGGGRFFWPIGGIFAFFLAVIAIQIGRRTRLFIDNLPEAQRHWVNDFMNLQLERKRATAGIAVGIVAIIANPLIGYFIILLVHR